MSDYLENGSSKPSKNPNIIRPYFIAMTEKK